MRWRNPREDGAHYRRGREVLWGLVVLMILVGEGYWLYWWVVLNPYPRRLIEEYVPFLAPGDPPPVFQELVVEAGRRYDVSVALINSVIWQESRFDPEARGKAGEIGLMQLRELAAREWADAEGLTNFVHAWVEDPRTNIWAGTWYLKKMLTRYGETDYPLVYALADYNAGRKNVLRWNEGIASTNSRAFFQNIDFPTTRRYIDAVVDRFARYYEEAAARKGKTGPAGFQSRVN